MRQNGRTDKQQKWLEAGYELFGMYGPNDFKVEKLASLVGQNKSGFYHYFLDRESFFVELLKYHEQNSIQFVYEITDLDQFLPGFIDIIIRYQAGVLVQLQLRRNQQIAYFKNCYLSVKKRSDAAHLTLWSNYLEIDDPGLALDLYDIATDSIIARMKSNQLNFDFLLGIYEGMRKTVKRLKMSKD